MKDLLLDPFSEETMSPNVFPKHDRNPIPAFSKIPISRPTITPQTSPQSPHKHPSRKKRPPSPRYLTKDTTIKSFNYSTGGEWDQESREQNMENIFSMFMSQISQAGHESTGLKEALELYKARGKKPPG
jgi:kinesin family protein C1